MAFLKETDAAYLRDQFAELLTGPVTLRLFTEPVGGLYVPGRKTCETCPEAEALMNEVAALSDQIRLEVVDVAAHPEVAREWGVNLTPTISIDAVSAVPKIVVNDRVEFLGALPEPMFLEAVMSALPQGAAGAADSAEDDSAEDDEAEGEAAAGAIS